MAITRRSRTYHNAGTGGRNYSKLFVTEYDNSFVPGVVSFTIQRDGKEANIALSEEQVQDLIQQLGRRVSIFTPPLAMIEGPELARV